MIILPDRNIPRAKILMPMTDKEWRTPSLSQSKDQFGNENVTKFSISAKSNDGVIIWKGWFDDRSDFDAFLWAIALGTLKQERSLWDLPTPNWQPYLGELITYEFATTTFLTTPTNTNQSYVMPIDWNYGNNNIQAIGGGASGGVTYNTGSGRASGGGGGAWNRTNNVPITRGTTAYYNIASGGASIVNSTSTGNNGNDTWFSVNNSAPTSTSEGVLAKGGLGGAGTSGATTNGGSGGTGSSGIGSLSYSGGKGGDVAHNLSAAGGGGAAGPSGDGNAGVNTTASSSGTAGGSGSAGSGGAGSGGTYSAGSTSSAAGGNGTNIQASPAFGSGGGSGGSSSGLGSSASGAGGIYGAGSGGSRGAGAALSSTSGAGGQGLIVITYEPFIPKGTFNMPNLGM